jgi:tetratricopeptide (TPR) repeat protein
MRSVCTRFLVLLVVAAFAVPAYAQLGLITGKVIDKDGKPVADAVVTIDREEVKFRQEVKTDKNGIYTKMGLEDATYKVSVSKNGTTLATDNNVVVSLGYRVDKTFDLRNQAPAASGAPISKAQREAEQKANSETQGAFNAGVAALSAGNHDEALKQFSLAAERRPALPVIHARLGETYMAARKFEDAANAYKKATELKPDEADYFNHLGTASIRATKFDAGKAAIQKAVDLDPKRAELAFLNLGILLADKAQDTDAAEALQKAIKANPKTADTYYQLGLIQMKNPATMRDAAAQFEKYLQLAPTGTNAATAKALADAAKASAPK